MLWGGHFQVDVMLFVVTVMWGIVPALIMGHHLPAPTRMSFVHHSNRRGQLSPFNCGKNQSKSPQRGLIKGTAIQEPFDRPTTFLHYSFSLRTWTKHGPHLLLRSNLDKRPNYPTDPPTSLLLQNNLILLVWEFGVWPLSEPPQKRDPQQPLCHHDLLQTGQQRIIPGRQAEHASPHDEETLDAQAASTDKNK